MDVPAASAGQPKGVPGAVVWIYVSVPPYVPAEGLVVGAGAAVVVDAGLAVVDAGAAAVVIDAAGFVVCVAVVVVVDGVLQPTINEAHKTRRHEMTMNFFTLEPPLYKLNS